MYRIPRIDCNVACPASLEEAFARTVRETVACNNWPADFPYAPQVGFRIFHTGADLLLRFDIAERCTAARTLDDNGPVWTDSCAEFFFRPEGSDSYYNFECNCIGTLLVGHRRDRTQAEPCPRRSAAHRAATRDLSARSAAGNRRRQPLDADARNPRRRTVPRPARKVGRRTGCDEPLQMRRRPLVPALPLMAAGRNACARFPPPRVLRTGIFRTEKTINVR